MTLIADDHYKYSPYSLRRGSSRSVKALSEPAERAQSRPIGFRVSQSRQNQADTSARSVRDLIQAVYQ